MGRRESPSMGGRNRQELGPPGGGGCGRVIRKVMGGRTGMECPALCDIVRSLSVLVWLDHVSGGFCAPQGACEQVLPKARYVF